ncbi:MULTISPECIES: DUF5959 family protein [unclassified Streptomyces]|uniref:DUF5959 family protein n=1 Tax=unclassified Streptomyces TaxID=2593676 RepID=UPI00093BBA1E|nr:DUF5959 family protein [Streptomyces sp. CB01249]OKJ01858.1 hypothetical protein AMK18_10560 [Streptomyces sp. CB01249]
MPDSSPVELMSLTDGEQVVSVRIVERMSFSGTDRYDTLRAEIVVDTGFVSGRVELYLNAYDLDRWAEVLESVAAGGKGTWLESGRSPRIMIDPTDENESGCTEVSVYDVTGSQVVVTVPLMDRPDWDAHRQMLAVVRSRFQLER